MSCYFQVSILTKLLTSWDRFMLEVISGVVVSLETVVHYVVT